MPSFPSLPFAAVLALVAAAPVHAAQEVKKPVADFSTCPKPVWPQESLRKEQQGVVTLAFLVGEDGAVRESKVLKSSGFPLLDTAAQEGIVRCRFQPGSVDGKSVASWANMQYVWTLKQGADGTPVTTAKAVPDTVAQVPAGFDKAAVTAAAEQGNAQAQVALARYYLAASSPERDAQRGVGLLRTAAEGGNVQAMDLLATVLYRGKEAPRDRAAAADWYGKAAAKGVANAQFMLGEMLLHGDGIARNEKLGEEWLRKSAAQNYVRAQAWLGALLLRRGEVTAETIALLEGAAGQGDPMAQGMLGWCNEQGSGVPQDFARAADWYRKGAAAGDVSAKRGLARLYDKGLGVPMDKAVAQALNRDAATGKAPLRPNE